ncbi:MAG: V-type ATP synthase subunit F [Deltaproteobacteria bacterium]|jgi:V/A-type H+-transporting ATPase subunit F|nr:V-type ATP synthase subunit F [Deltaproteobacteria bacterium]
MKEVLILTPEEAMPGFARAGVRQVALSANQAQAAIEEFCRDATIGVLAVDERLMQTIDPDRVQELIGKWPGVLVTLPAPAGFERPAEDELQRLVRRALGYHVRLES